MTSGEHVPRDSTEKAVDAVLETGADQPGGRDGRPADDPHAPHRNNLFRGLVDRAAAAEVSQERMRHLLDAVLSVASDLSLPDVLRRIVAAGCELSRARYGALDTFGQDGALVEFARAGGALPARAKAVLSLVTDRPLRLPAPADTDFSALAELTKPTSTGPADADRTDAAARAEPGRPEPGRTVPGRLAGVGSFLGVPIRARGEVFGNLYLAEKIGGCAFTQEDEDVVVALAAAAGMAIENARHYDLSRRRERWLRATTEVTAVLRTTAGEAEGLDLLVRRAREVPAAALAFVAGPSGPEHMLIRGVDGVLRDELSGLRLPIVESITGDVFSTGRPRVLTEVVEASATRSVATFHRLPQGIDALGPAMFVPMTAGQHTTGVLMVARGRGAARFDDDDLRMITDFATHAALAIEFADAQQDRQRLALYEERDRIARDLHDLVIQRLFAIGLGLHGLKRATGPDAAERLAGFTDEIDQTIREVRRSIFSLQQPANGPYSLRGEILRAISDATVSLGFEPTVRLEGPLDSVVPADVALDLIATLREALSNVVRHAGAGGVAVTVSVDRGATRLGLLVRDDGRGLPPSIRHRSGLANMVQRARRWRGDCEIDSPEPGGTRVDWAVPLPSAGTRGQEACE
ncbi:sensor histidine kinase [Actinokineospora iranica]|uniref:GAF domain-containing protein n=1 Tax=Actinokineospora iranica TaxID=1271860 RepID=A0A1G6J505_9PSEU|nr:GAF domain-containing protein [Actinokineospora iranica]SDC13902.1 GAF domain-containing protein [Actinokineospora iranica]